ncbi:MAG: hypothetical protein IJ733_10125, partial [Lachnospiraceae bacterium]|nr:hypothetical protein [Lachnospiraceae bacterium]
MKQYELAIRIAQIHHLVDERKYKKALAVIQTLDMHQVRSLSDLKVFAEVYTKTEQYDAAKATYLRIYRRSRTKRVLYRLIYLSIRTNALNEAESYYQEFIRMNPNVRDSLILRYRIDKAAGAPIEQLIEILQQLKQEEYIEEWAYELAKLYHRAGRKEECIEECEDILLWFGTGEIVQRAKLLIEHLREKEPMPYYDDKDFTLPVKEEPNPEDTGSLPDLEEFIREQKAQKREERKEGRFFRRDSGKADEEKAEKKDSKGTKENRDKKSVKEEQKDEFIDDYEDTAFETDDAPLPHIARDGFQIISDLLKFGKKEEDKKEERREEERDAENRKEQVKEERKQKEKAEEEEEKGKENRPEKAEKHAEKEKTEKHAEKEKESLEQRPLEKKESSKLPEYIPPSQSGTGITQDLAREISAIYEMEQREQLQEKQVTVIDKEDSSNIAENVVQRMTNALQKNPTKTTKTYIPIDVEEIRGEDRITEVNGPEEKTKVIEPIREEEDIFEDEMYHEMFGEESSEEDFELSSVQEKSGDDSRQDESGEKPDAVMQEKVEKEEIGQAREESPDENILDKEESLSDKEENISDKEENISGIKESISSESKLESLLEQEVAEIQQAM